MTNYFYRNTYNRVINLLLVVVFLFSYPTGATALALCLDQDENHIVDQNLYLDNCHSATGTFLPLSEEHCSARAEREDNDCVDVSLSNANILNLPPKTALPANAKDILSYTLPSDLVGLQQQVTGQNPPVSFPYLSNTLHLKVHRTTVLLI
ncbi:hypothetical protein ACFLYW_02700 [Thermodesulfobacteriota bacterium]